MRYTFFEFENFKGIRKARLELSVGASAARVYTLVGLNESGKTTVLEAIDHFQPTSEGAVTPKQLGGWVAPDPHSLIPIAERTNFTGKIRIRCGIELDDDDVVAAKAFLRSADGYRLSELDRDIVITDEYAYEDSRFVKRTSNWSGLRGTGRTKKGRLDKELSHAKDNARWNSLTTFVRRHLPTIWFFPHFLFDFPDKIYIEEYAEEPPANQFYRALFQDILDALPRDLDVTKHIVERKRSGKSSEQENLQQVLLEASRHVTDTVVSSWNHIFRDKPMSHKNVRIDVGEDEQSGLDDAGQPRPSKLWVRFRLEDTDGLFSVRERSLGFRWFFVYLLITTYRGRRKGSPSDMLFLFDEPASNLHQTAQRALLSSLGELSREAVIIYTTHSHHLIQPMWLGTTFVVTNAGLEPDALSADFSAERTDIHITPYRQFAAKHPDQSHYFQPILDVLEYVPSELELIPDVIMVEGKTDYYLLSYYQSVMLNLPPTERLNLMPGGGAGSMDDALQLYLGWSRPFVALLDSDRAGLAQTSRYLEKFGLILKPHLMTLADGSGKENAKGIESLLNDHDKLNLQRVADPGAQRYRKKSLALGVQEALLAGQQVKMSAAARRAFDRIFASLRERLDEVRAEMDR
jgi:hypothetical protein